MVYRSDLTSDLKEASTLAVELAFNHSARQAELIGTFSRPINDLLKNNNNGGLYAAFLSVKYAHATAT